MRHTKSGKRLPGLAVKAFLMLCFGLIATSCYYNYTWLETGEHVAKVSWLPEEATDVTYFRSYTYTTYEFSISEQGFLSWANGQGWDVGPIGDEVRVRRPFSLMTPFPREPTGSASREDQSRYSRACEEWLKQSSAVVTDGYTAEYRPRRDRGYTVAYDRKAGRVYYERSAR